MDKQQLFGVSFGVVFNFVVMSRQRRSIANKHIRGQAFILIDTVSLGGVYRVVLNVRVERIGIDEAQTI